MKVEEFMTANPVTLSEGDDLAKVQQLFDSEPFHHLLVEENAAITGVISDRDVLRVLNDYVKVEGVSQSLEKLNQMKVVDFMSPKVVTVGPDTDINTASILLLEHNFSCLPVVNDNMGILGIVTWKDILKIQVYDANSD